MAWTFVISTCGGIAALAVARYMTSPGWIIALIAAAGLFGLAAGLAVGLMARRWRRNRSWQAGAALALGAAAAATRVCLVAQIERLGAPAELLPLALACASVAWGALALLWGVAGVMDSVAPLSWPALAASAVAVVLSLYTVAPLGRLLGVQVNHYTLLGLFGLSAIAWGVAAGLRRIAGGRAGPSQPR